MRRTLALLMLCAVLAQAWADSIKPPSLRDKIAQMLIIGFDGKSINAHSPVVKAIKEQHIGGVILFDYNSRSQNFDKILLVHNK